MSPFSISMTFVVILSSVGIFIALHHSRFDIAYIGMAVLILGVEMKCQLRQLWGQHDAKAVKGEPKGSNEMAERPAPPQNTRG